MTSNIAKLNDFGQAPWYDNITRTMVREGGLEALVRDDGIRGVTSNPTIFEKAIAGGEGYDDAIAAAQAGGDSIEDTFWDLAVDDIGRRRRHPPARCTTRSDGKRRLHLDRGVAASSPTTPTRRSRRPRSCSPGSAGPT